MSSPLFSPVDYETDAAADQFDYGVGDSSFLPEQPGKPPLLITRYRLLFSILLALDFATVSDCSYSDA